MYLLRRWSTSAECIGFGKRSWDSMNTTTRRTQKRAEEEPIEPTNTCPIEIESTIDSLLPVERIH